MDAEKEAQIVTNPSQNSHLVLLLCYLRLLRNMKTLCTPRVDCQPRNDIYNVSIQFLNVFFTYMATVSMPWRATNFIHAAGCGCPRRENAPGHDLYGQISDDVWFHVPLRKRIVILVFLLLNCITQHINQVTRIVYYNYDLQNEFPGNMWTNIFFGASMICAAVGGGLIGYHTGKVRATNPQRFGKGPVELVRDLVHKYVLKQEQEEAVEVEQGDGGGQEESGNAGQAEEAVVQEEGTPSQAGAPRDPTREPLKRSVIVASRSSLRMFAL